MAEDPRIIAIDKDTGRAESARYHLFYDCSFIKDRKPEEVELIGDREARLLGLKVCSVCERRKTGGPALAALSDVLRDLANDLEQNGTDKFHADTAAWTVVNALKEKGIYLAARGKKDA